jgi:uncharacterized protein (UPF0212 family)
MTDCPACGATVDVAWVFGYEECHECNTPLVALIEQRTREVADE